MIELDEVIDAECEVEGKPDDDYRCEGCGDFAGTQWLYEEKQDEYGTGDAYDCTVRDVWLYDLQTLDRT